MLAGKLSKSLFTLRKTMTFLFYFWKSARKSKAIFMEYSEPLIFWGFLMVPWGRGYHYYTTSFNKAWIKVLRRFKSCCMSEIRDGEDFCRWSWLEIRLNAFPRSPSLGQISLHCFSLALITVFYIFSIIFPHLSTIF